MWTWQGEEEGVKCNKNGEGDQKCPKTVHMVYVSMTTLDEKFGSDRELSFV